MDAQEFRKRGKEMVDFIADYLENINERRVTPNIEPGYLKKLLPLKPPTNGEDWDKIMSDIEAKIMPGVTHWQHSRFHAYFPAGNSYPSILGDMLSSGLGIIGFSWASSPACTELETIVMHWLGVMSGLDKSLLPFVDDSEIEELIDQNSNINNNELSSIEESQGQVNNRSRNNSLVTNAHWGGGVLLGSASECVLVSMLAARGKAISNYKRNIGFEDDGVILTKLIAYTSILAHSCVEKAAMISLVKLRMLDFDEKFSLRGNTLRQAIQEDIEQGLIPFYVCGTFGTTSCCSFDNIIELGYVCQEFDVYLHVDAAYAGNALICQELRPLMAGTELVDSFSFNPNKWMLVNFDSSCLWVKDKYTLTKALSVDPTYLHHRQMEKTIDYRHWGIPLSRRFRSLKLWFTIRSYGVEGLQKYIREHVRLAKEFEKLVLNDERFEIFGQVNLGLVCFRLKGPDILSKNLVLTLNDSGKLHITPVIVSDKYVIRFCVNSKKANINDIETAWEIIKETAEKILIEHKEKPFLTNMNDIEQSEAEDLYNMTKMRRKSLVRMVSDPIKIKTVNSISICGFKRSKFNKTQSFIIYDLNEDSFSC